MRGLVTQIRRLAADVFGIVTSLDRLKALWRNPLYSNAVYMMVAYLATAAFGFVFWIVAARFYSVSDVGLASALVSAMNLLSILSSLGFGYAMIGFLGASKKPVGLVNSGFTIVGLAAIAAALVFMLGVGLWSPALVYTRNNPAYLIFFVLVVPAAALSTLTDNTLIARRKAGYALARGLLFNVVRAVLPVLLAGQLHSFGIYASWGAAVFVSLSFGMFVLLPRALPGYRPAIDIDRESLGGVMQFTFANYLGDLLCAAPVLILQSLMVVNLLGSESNAYFAIAWAMGSILNSIPTAVSVSLFAEGSHDEGKLQQTILRSAKMTFLVLTPAVVLVLVLADKLLLLFGAAYSENGATLLRLFAVSAFPLGVNYLYFGTRRVERRMRVPLLLMLLAGAVTLSLSYLLMPRMGIAGAGVAWLASQSGIALVVVIHWLVKNHNGLRP